MFLDHVNPGSSKKNGWIKTSLIFIYLIDWVMLVLFLLMPVIKWGYIIMCLSNKPWSFRITTVMSPTFHIIPKDPSGRKEWLKFLPCFPDDSVLKDVTIWHDYKPKSLRADPEKRRCCLFLKGAANIYNFLYKWIFWIKWKLMTPLNIKSPFWQMDC